MNFFRLLARHLYEQDSSAIHSAGMAEPVYLIMGNEASKWLAERVQGHFMTRQHEPQLASRLYQLGCSHVEVRRAYDQKYVLPAGGSKSTWFDHPLNIASLLLRRGLHHDAISVVNEYKMMVDAGELSRQKKLTDKDPFAGFFPDHFSNNVWTTMPICPYRAKDLGIDPLMFSRQFDLVGFSGWYQPASLLDTFEDAGRVHNVLMLQRIANTLGGESERAADTATFRYLRKEIGSTRTNYHDVAIAMRAASPEMRRRAMNGMKGAALACWALLPDASTEEMSIGLSQLARNSEGSRDDALQVLGRPPTVDEILSIRSKGIVDVLFRMPWEFLTPVATDTEQAAKISGRMAKYLKNRDLDVIKYVLVEHNHRKVPLKVPPNIDHLAEPVEPEATAWSQFATDIEFCREHNLGVRERLLEAADGDPEVAVLFGMYVLVLGGEHWSAARVLTDSARELISQLPGFAQVEENPGAHSLAFVDKSYDYG